MDPVDPLAGVGLPPVSVDTDGALDRTRARGQRRQRRRTAVLAAGAVGVVLLVVALAAAATGDDDREAVVAESPSAPGEPRVCRAPEGSPLDVAHEPGWRPHAAYSDVTDEDGCLVRIDVIAVRAGPAHCGYGAARVLTAGDPIGTSYAAGADGAQYVRDPDGVFGDPDLAAGFDGDVQLPPGAEPSGYLVGGNRLWVLPGDLSAVWLSTAAGRIERWPRGTTPICD